MFQYFYKDFYGRLDARTVEEATYVNYHNVQTESFCLFNDEHTAKNLPVIRIQDTYLQYHPVLCDVGNLVRYLMDCGYTVVNEYLSHPEFPLYSHLVLYNDDDSLVLDVVSESLCQSIFDLLPTQVIHDYQQIVRKEA